MPIDPQRVIWDDAPPQAVPDPSRVIWDDEQDIGQPLPSQVPTQQVGLTQLTGRPTPEDEE